MAKTRILVQRRKAIRNIRKITRTMELIATARFRKALDRAVEAEAFTRKIAELAADLSANATEISHPLLAKRDEVKNSALLVICSNRGLCGGYNAGILREGYGRAKLLRADNIGLHLDVSGKRAIAYLKYQGIAIENAYTHFEDKPRFEEVEVLADRYLKLFISHQIDRLDVAYMKFFSAARQQAVVATLLPLASAVPETTRPASQPGAGAVQYEFYPGVKDILEEILPVSFKVRLFKCFLDAAVSEQIGRRVAMKAATDSADKMIKSLSRQYNRARQAQITKEISEIIGGVEALK